MQAHFADREYASNKRFTRRDRFRDEIEAVTPWSALVAEIEPLSPKGEGPGRPYIGAKRTLRMPIAQQCFGLSDEGIEGTLYDSQALRRFIQIDLNSETALDATTLLKFRSPLETNKLIERIFTLVHTLLVGRGLLLRKATIVDTTVVAAPYSTKRDGMRNLEIGQTKEEHQWHFGVKAHVGVRADSGLATTLVTTPAKLTDITQARLLLQGDETSRTFLYRGERAIADWLRPRRSCIRSPVWRI